MTTVSPRTAPRHTNDSRIAQARLAAGLTQAQLAERIGLKSYTSIKAWELGQRVPKLGTLRKLAAALGVSWQDLIDEDDRP